MIGCIAFLKKRMKAQVVGDIIFCMKDMKDKISKIVDVRESVRYNITERS